MHKIRIPSLAENVEQATVSQWLVQEGETVEAGQGVVDLITEKAEFTLETEMNGVVSARLAPEKSVLPVGTILCLLDASDADVEAAKTENHEIMNQLLVKDTIHEEVEPGDKPTRAASGIRATPAARRLAREHDLDLAEIAEALSIDGAVKEEHVRRYLEQS